MELKEIRVSLVAAYQSGDEAEITKLETALESQKTAIRVAGAAKAKAEYDAMATKRVELASEIVKAIKGQVKMAFDISLDSLIVAKLVLGIDANIISKVRDVKGDRIAFTPADANVAGSVASVALATPSKAHMGNRVGLKVVDVQGQPLGLEASYQMFANVGEKAEFVAAESLEGKAKNSKQWAIKSRVRARAIAEGLLKAQA